jgi:hypothetical protein
MTKSLAHVFVAILVLAPGAPASADQARDAGRDIEILVNGVPRTRYAHAGRSYVEAVKGKEYAIRLHNPYPVRVGVALSVDGLNTIDARETTAGDARKWVLAPYETVTISGWQTNRSEARRFEFTTEERSYGQALGKTTNLGVIAAVFFKERMPVSLRAPEHERESSSDVEAPSAPSASAALGSSDRRSAGKAAQNEYAATGMGRRTDHAVEQVRLDLEGVAAASVSIRYEFSPQLVRLGILAAPSTVDPLRRRERAQGFEPGYCPEPPQARR